MVLVRQANIQHTAHCTFSGNIGYSRRHQASVQFRINKAIVRLESYLSVSSLSEGGTRRAAAAAAARLATTGSSPPSRSAAFAARPVAAARWGSVMPDSTRETSIQDYETDLVKHMVLLSFSLHNMVQLHDMECAMFATSIQEQLTQTSAQTTIYTVWLWKLVESYCHLPDESMNVGASIGSHHV